MNEIQNKILDKAFSGQWITLGEIKAFGEGYELSYSHGDMVLHLMEWEINRIEKILEREGNVLSEDDKIQYAGRMRRCFETLSALMDIVSNVKGTVTFRADMKHDFDKIYKSDKEKGYRKILEELFTKYGGHGTEKLILQDKKNKGESPW